MKKFHLILILAVSMVFFTTRGHSQEIQEFGPGVHQDLDHRIETRSICVPNPNKDINYDFKKSFAANVNAAIKSERTAFGNKKIGNYVHPAYYSDPVDYANKIITALRKAYSEAYNIKVIGVPVNESVATASQNHSCKMISCNQFTHQSSCTGSPKSRITAQVGDWGSCLTGYSENIAINTAKTIEGAMEWAIFGMMYNDLGCCNNGHRENFLKCTYDDNWRMGFGYKKGKYSFGSSRSYDAWFMTWDYAKKGNSSSCSWDENKGKKECSSTSVVAIQNLKVNGQNDCSSLKTTWTATNTGKIQSFEVYQSTNGKTYSKVATVSPNSGKTYSANFNTSGNEAKVFVKAVTKEGGFHASDLFVFNVSDCKPSENPTNPDPKSPAPEPNNPDGDVTDNNPPAPQPEPEPEPEPQPELDPTKIVAMPNPADNEIKLKDIKYGSIFRVYTIQGRLAIFGFYRNKIQINQLRPGTYVIYANGKTGQFVKL